MKQIIEKVFTNSVILNGVKNLKPILTTSHKTILNRFVRQSPYKGKEQVSCAKHTLKNLLPILLFTSKTNPPQPSLTKGGSKVTSLLPLGEGRILNELASCKNSGEGAFTLAEVFSSCRKVKLNFGFTLAEVLITLGIIGVVAALTIPSLIEKHKEKVTITRVKQSYSILNQAFNMAVNENGPLNNWDIETADGRGCGTCAVQFTEILVKYMKRVEKCYGSSVGTDADGNLVYDKGENVKCGGTDRARPLLLDGSDSHYSADLYVSVNFARSILANGTYISNSTLSSAYTGRLYLDINGGKQKPNQFGIDLFMFIISPDGIHPYGMGNKALVDRECNKNSEGKTCAAWILMYDNMDYLRK